MKEKIKWYNHYEEFFHIIFSTYFYSYSDEENTNVEQLSLENTPTIQTASIEEINEYINAQQNAVSSSRTTDNEEGVNDIIFIDIIDSEAQIGVWETELNEQSSQQFVFFKRDGELIKSQLEIISYTVYQG